MAPRLLEPHGLHLLLEINGVSIDTSGLLDEEKGHDGAEDVAGEEDPEGVGHADFVGRQVIEEHARQNRAQFACRGRHAVCETPHAGWEDLTRDDEGRGVRAEVEEELYIYRSVKQFRGTGERRAYLSKCEANEFPASANMVVVTRDHAEHERTH